MVIKGWGMGEGRLGEDIGKFIGVIGYIIFWLLCKDLEKFFIVFKIYVFYSL